MKQNREPLVHNINFLKQKLLPSPTKSKVEYEVVNWLCITASLFTFTTLKKTLLLRILTLEFLLL